MRVYIIGNDGITLCRKAPATVNDGGVAIASNKELHAAPLSGKQLLALWNALPGVPKRRKVGDRDALIDQLWSAIEMLPDPEPATRPEAPVEAGCSDCNAASARGCNGRRGSERDRLAAPYRFAASSRGKKLGLTLALFRFGRERCIAALPASVKTERISFSSSEILLRANSVSGAKIPCLAGKIQGISSQIRRLRGCQNRRICSNATP